MKKYQDHDYAKLFPMMEGAELLSLAEDIKENGLRAPITLLEGKVLDGRNRLKACEMIGIEPMFREHRNGDPLKFVISVNLSRRHLTESQRAMAAAKISNLQNGQNKADLPLSPANLQGGAMSVSQAAKSMNVSERSVRSAKKVLRDAPDKVEAIEQGKESIHGVVSKIKENEDKRTGNKPKQGRETWGPKDKKASQQAFGRFVRIVDKAPFWKEIKGEVEKIAKAIRQ